MTVPAAYASNTPYATACRRRKPQERVCGERKRAGRDSGILPPVDPVEALIRLGGTAPTAELLALTSRRRLRRAILSEEDRPVVPQLEVRAGGLVLHPDLVDPLTGVVFEADSWEFHAKDRGAFERDCERYTALVVEGWRVLRFTWRNVVHRPDQVRRCLRSMRSELAA